MQGRETSQEHGTKKKQQPTDLARAGLLTGILTRDLWEESGGGGIRFA
jgi:hypothetical protein